MDVLREVERNRIMITNRIAVIMTCYNRKDTTIACLEALMQQEITDDIHLQVYLVDDGCTDGTGHAVRNRFPDVRVLHGNGKLYWCGGMRSAFKEAMKGDYDYYLWLNDDTMLFQRALRTLMETASVLRQANAGGSVIVGAVRDPKTGDLTYSGMAQWRRWKPLPLHRLEPSTKPKPCDTMNGNCVLIPREVTRAVGNLSTDFSHRFGDFDYGLRATAMGFSCWIAPGFVGTCSKGVGGKPIHPTPPQEWMRFTRRHAGILWPIFWIRTIVGICFRFLNVTAFQGSKLLS
jgi:GT2 family glycosyltransferase